MTYTVALNFEDGVTRFVTCKPTETVVDAACRRPGEGAGRPVAEAPVGLGEPGGHPLVQPVAPRGVGQQQPGRCVDAHKAAVPVDDQDGVGSLRPCRTGLVVEGAGG